MYIEFEGNKSDAEYIIDVLEWGQKQMNENGNVLNGLKFPGSYSLFIDDTIDSIRSSIFMGREMSGSDLEDEVEDIESLRSEVEELESKIEDLEDDLNKAQVTFESHHEEFVGGLMTQIKELESSTECNCDCETCDGCEE